MVPAKRQFTGVAVKGYKAVLQQMDLLETVLPRLPPETLALLDRPLLPISWVDAEHVDRVLQAVADTVGDQKVVELAHAYMQSTIGPILGPLVKTTLGLFGSSPAMLISRYDGIVRVVLRGVSSTTVREGERTLRFRITTVDRPAPAWFVSQQAALLVGCEMCGCSGRIDGFEVEPDGQHATYRLSWEPAARPG